MAITDTATGMKAPNIEQVTWNELTWYNIVQPTPTDIKYLASHFPFHPLDLDDCLSRIQRAKIDIYPDYLFVVLNFPVYDRANRVTVASQVAIFIGKDYLITLHAGILKPLVKLFQECQASENARQENMKSSGYLLYRVVDRLVDYCIPILQKIMANIEKVEVDIFDTTTPDPIQDLAEIRRDVLSYRRIASPMRTVIMSLEARTQTYVKRDLAVYWGDVNDHMDKIWDTLEEYKEIVEGLHDTLSTLASHHTNAVVRVLTIISTIMLPLTLVASIYGMNIHLPGASHPLFFVILLLLMVIIIGVMMGFFHHRRWI